MFSNIQPFMDTIAKHIVFTAVQVDAFQSWGFLN